MGHSHATSRNTETHTVQFKWQLQTKECRRGWFCGHRSFLEWRVCWGFFPPQRSPPPPARGGSGSPRTPFSRDGGFMGRKCPHDAFHVNVPRIWFWSGRRFLLRMSFQMSRCLHVTTNYTGHLLVTAVGEVGLKNSSTRSAAGAHQRGPACKARSASPATPASSGQLCYFPL